MNGMYTRETAPANSTVNFVLDLSLNDTTVTCTSPRNMTCILYWSYVSFIEWF